MGFPQVSGDTNHNSGGSWGMGFPGTQTTTRVGVGGWVRFREPPIPKAVARCAAFEGRST